MITSKAKEAEKTQKKPLFKFKQFNLEQDQCSMKITTDGVLLGAWAPVAEIKNALDIGTGSGVIALMLAQRTEDARIKGIEIDENSASQALENANKSPWAERIFIKNISIQDFNRNTDETFDLIVSNPPFFTGGTFSQNQEKTNVRHTVKLPHGDLLLSARKLLSSKGKFCVVLPTMEGLRFVEMAATYGLFCTRKTEVFTVKGKTVERLLLQFETKFREMETDQLVVNEPSGFSKEYRLLTKDFYLDF
ncbi:MAG: methyltransferase [Saprospiraceae bacterium]